MIDFRYHLVSIVAVLLALSIGIVLGTGALGGPLLEDLQSNVAELRSDIQARRAENAELRKQLDIETGFASAAEPFILEGALTDSSVVVVEFQGTPGTIGDEIRNAIAVAGGRVDVTVEILDKFRLDGEVDPDELALALSSVTGDPDELRTEAAGEIGARMAQAASGSAGTGATTLLESLAEAGFVDIEREGDTAGPTIPEGAAFLVVGGSPEDAPFDVASFSLTLSTAIAAGDAPVLMCEPAESRWGLVETVRNDGDARDVVATADGVETPPGRVAAILGLSRATQEQVGHYGRGPGAGQFLPEPNPVD